MKNPNNCSTCDYRTPNVEGAHCYMWKDAPTNVCRSHTGRQIIVGTIGHVSRAKGSLMSTLIAALMASKKL